METGGEVVPEKQTRAVGAGGRPGGAAASGRGRGRVPAGGRVAWRKCSEELGAHLTDLPWPGKTGEEGALPGAAGARECPQKGGRSRPRSSAESERGFGAGVRWTLDGVPEPHGAGNWGFSHCLCRLLLLPGHDLLSTQHRA